MAWFTWAVHPLLYRCFTLSLLCIARFRHYLHVLYRLTTLLLHSCCTLMHWCCRFAGPKPAIFCTSAVPLLHTWCTLFCIYSVLFLHTWCTLCCTIVVSLLSLCCTIVSPVQHPCHTFAAPTRTFAKLVASFPCIVELSIKLEIPNGLLIYIYGK